ncbi:unnamed protein product [Trichogramma brassicae]|uniref:Peroxisomal membrane protein 11C n=1 Tax=Trichogramma brassicae TaxID=86971 RepID=A0A6H5IVB4_9HYME|nr:unnamed protein product [Trichogramma brassicae]
MNIALVSDYLDSYEGRDKFLRTLSYAAKMASGFPTSNDTADKFKKFGSKMSGARVILRLLDDIPNIHSVMTYGTGQKEPDWLIRTIELIKITVDLLYSPVEHICWAGENNLVSIDIEKWGNATTWFWIGSLYLSLLKTLRKYKLLKKQEMNFCKKEIDPRFELCNKLSAQRDIVGGKFSAFQVGALGTISSLIGVYQALTRKMAQRYS